MSSQAALKIAHNGEIHRSRVDLNVFHLSDLTRLIAQTFHLEAGTFVIQYTDAEGDRLNVCSDDEYAEACRVFLSSTDAVKSLKFVAVLRSQASFQEKVADPIVQSIENLIQALTATVEKVKNENWANSSQATTEALSKVAQGARHTNQELPYEQVLKESTGGAKTAAEGFSSFAQGLVGQIKQFIPEKVERVAPEAEQKAPTPVAAAPVASPAPEQVAPASAPPAPVAPPLAVAVETASDTPVAGVPVAFSDAEAKWSDELSLVRSIFPNVGSARVIDMLEQCGGNVNVVLNTLMEEM
jgi:hypothetical protein